MDAAHKPLYGLMAEFSDPTALVEAAKRTHAEGYRRVDAFTPFPMHELFDALDLHEKKLQLTVLGAGILGAFAGFGLCYWTQVIAYPLNIGGKPYNSWPAWIPITFECTILLAAFGAVFGMLALNGLPMPYHPVFNVRRFDSASRDKFFLVIQTRDPKFRLDEVRQFLRSLGPREVTDVPW